MLLTLEICDFGLIKRETIEFKSGLNVITGETGAGKSTAIEALNVLFGQKANYSDINLTDTGKTTIEGCFQINKESMAYLQDIEIDCGVNPDTIIISREISAKTSKSRINGTIVNSQILNHFKDIYLNFHSQHETINLLKESQQLVLFDDLGDSSYQSLKTSVQNYYRQLLDTKRELKDCLINEDERLKRLNYLEFCVNEIKQANIQDKDEDKTIENRKLILKNQKQIKELTETVNQLLNGGYQTSDYNSNSIPVLEQLDKLTAKLTTLQNYNLPVNNFIEAVNNAIASLEDVVKGINQFNHEDEFIETDLDSIDERLHELARLKRKYGSTLEEIIASQKLFEDEIDQLNSVENRKNELENRINDFNLKFLDSAKKLSKLRQSQANILSKLIVSELKDLDMKEAIFKINILPLDTPNHNGLEEIEFLITTNQGINLAPISKIASGGELSRIMLAIKSVFASSLKVKSLVFDEIDAGLSGKTVQKVALKLKKLSQTHQLIVITHQPIIASHADHHLLASKETIDNQTSVKIKGISDKPDRLLTIANMVSSGNDKAALDFAQSLLNTHG